jgi:dephospho-CoA kinase
MGSSIMSIFFLGQQCAGKTSAAKTLQTIIPNAIVKFATPLYMINEALQIPKNRAFMQEMSDLAKKYYGQDVFVRIFERTYGHLGNLINDDCRYKLEVAMLQEESWRSCAILADTHIRKQRAEKLGLSFIENHPSELEVPESVSKCDYIITNNGTLSDFQRKVRLLANHNLPKGEIE